MKLRDNGLDSFKKAIKKLQQINNISPGDYEYEIKDIIISLHHSIGDSLQTYDTGAKLTSYL